MWDIMVEEFREFCRDARWIIVGLLAFAGVATAVAIVGTFTLPTYESIGETVVWVIGIALVLATLGYAERVMRAMKKRNRQR